MQLGLEVQAPKGQTYKHVLHYPFYANKVGVLYDWGSLEHLETVGAGTFSVDFAAQIGDSFNEESMSEEPYLAFAVAYDDDMLDGILEQVSCHLGATPPRLEPIGA